MEKKAKDNEVYFAHLKIKRILRKKLLDVMEEI